MWVESLNIKGKVSILGGARRAERHASHVRCAAHAFC